MAYILHIDTSSDKGLVALARNGELLAQEETATARDHASSINVMIDKVVQKAAISLKEIDAIAVIGGPGSYTGLRIGLATAKALCYVLEKPLIMSNKLTLLALQQSGEGKAEHDYFASILPARQKEYFFSVYDDKGECIKEPAHALAEDVTGVLAGLNGKTLLAGTIVDLGTGPVDSDHIDFVENEIIDLAYWCAKAQSHFDCHRFVNLANAEPFYLKQVYTHKP